MGPFCSIIAPVLQSSGLIYSRSHTIRTGTLGSAGFSLQWVQMTSSVSAFCFEKQAPCQTAGLENQSLIRSTSIDPGSRWTTLVQKSKVREILSIGTDVEKALKGVSSPLGTKK